MDEGEVAVEAGEEGGDVPGEGVAGGDFEGRDGAGEAGEEGYEEGAVVFGYVVGAVADAAFADVWRVVSSSYFAVFKFG